MLPQLAKNVSFFCHRSQQSFLFANEEKVQDQGLPPTYRVQVQDNTCYESSGTQQEVLRVTQDIRFLRVGTSVE